MANDFSVKNTFVLLSKSRYNAEQLKTARLSFLSVLGDFMKSFKRVIISTFFVFFSTSVVFGSDELGSDKSKKLKKCQTTLTERMPKSSKVSDYVTINKYYKLLKNSIPLSNQREIELSRIIQAGGKDSPYAQKAVAELVQGSLRYAVSVARRYPTDVLTLPELISAANEGLVEAAWGYQPEKESLETPTKFITYAVWLIKKSIHEAFYNITPVRFPAQVFLLVNKIRSISREMQSQNQELDLEELAKRVDSTPEKVQELLLLSSEAISLDAPLSGTQNGTYSDLVAAETQFIVTEDLENDFKEFFSYFSERQQFIIKMRYGFGKEEPASLKKVAEVLKVSGERVRQLEIPIERKFQRPEVMRVAQRIQEKIQQMRDH